MENGEAKRDLSQRFNSMLAEIELLEKMLALVKAVVQEILSDLEKARSKNP